MDDNDFVGDYRDIDDFKENLYRTLTDSPKESCLILLEKMIYQDFIYIDYKTHIEVYTKGHTRPTFFLNMN